MQTVITLVLSLCAFSLIGVADLQAQSSSPNCQVAVSVKPAPTYSEHSPEIVCELTNRGNTVADYDQWLESLGFDFRLVGQNENEIKMDETWFKRFSPRYREWSKTKTARLPPGESISFRLNMREAFGERWRLGNKLYIDWHQQGSLSVSPTVSTSISLPRAFNKDIGNRSSNSTRPLVSLPLTTSPSQKSPASMPHAQSGSMVEEASPIAAWCFAFAALIAAVGLWLVFKKHS